MSEVKPVYTVYGQRYNKYDPFVLEKDIKDIGLKGTVLDDGQPKKIRLSQWTDLKMAENFAENVKNNTPKRMWKIWIE